MDSSEDAVELSLGITPSKQCRPSPYLVPVVFEKQSPLQGSIGTKGA